VSAFSKGLLQAAVLGMVKSAHLSLQDESNELFDSKRIGATLIITVYP
jgi:hypothetical protein